MSYFVLPILLLILKHFRNAPFYILQFLPHSWVEDMFSSYLSRVVRKPAFCICENKGADQLRGNREADQRLCFRYMESVIPLLSKFKISSL